MFSSLSPMGVASSRHPSFITSITVQQDMGATDILPYPRRRSSIQLEPLECRLTQEQESHSPPVKSRTGSTGTSEEVLLPGAVMSSSHPSLAPVRTPGHRKLTGTTSDDTRCNSCENPRRGRSQSLHQGRVQRPGESRRRLASNDLDDDAETTAEFIEKLRKELISQLHHV